MCVCYITIVKSERERFDSLILMEIRGTHKICITEVVKNRFTASKHRIALL